MADASVRRLAAKLVKMDGRLLALEGAPQLGNSSITIGGQQLRLSAAVKRGLDAVANAEQALEEAALAREEGRKALEEATAALAESETAREEAAAAVAGVATAQEDANQALADAAAAQQTADGKNHIVRSPTRPDGTDWTQGDLWMQTAGDAATGTVDENAILGIRVWNGTDWVPSQLLAGSILVPGSLGAVSIADGAVTAPAIKAGAVTAEKIAAAAIIAEKIAAGEITSEHVQAAAITALHLAAGSVTAEKIAAGQVTGEHILARTIEAINIAAGTITGIEIAAGSITAEKMTIGDTTNLIDDPGFENATATWRLTTGHTIVDTTGGPGRAILATPSGSTRTSFNGLIFAVKEGEQFRVTARVQNDMNGYLHFGVQWLNEAKVTINQASLEAVPPGTSFTKDNANRTLTATVPARASYGRFVVQTKSDATTGQAWLTKPRILRMMTGELIVNGAIDGQTITGAVVRTAASGLRVEIAEDRIRLFDRAGQSAGWIWAGATVGGASGAGFTLSNSSDYTGIYIGQYALASGGYARAHSPEMHIGILWADRLGTSAGDNGIPVQQILRRMENTAVYETAGGTNSGNYPDGTVRDVAVTFPSGRFSQPPVVVSSVSEVRVQHAVRERTRTGCTIRTWNNSGGNASNNYVYWHAIQMTTQSAGD